MKYIGITGHRGSGKTSTGYLLGNTIDMLLKGYSKEDILDKFPDWCDAIKQSKNAVYDCALTNVYFNTFGEMPKSFVAQLLSIDMSLLDSDTMKDNMFVNMNDFKLYTLDDSFTVIGTDDILNNTSRRWKDRYISLRDFTKCLSIDIMQKYFGADVWLKSLKVNDEKWSLPNNSWTIFLDVKTKEETKYIEEKNGILVKTIRPSHKKSNSGIITTDQEDTNFIINTEGELIDLFDSIYDVSKEILEKN